jgi:hypothetical protein
MVLQIFVMDPWRSIESLRTFISKHARLPFRSSTLEMARLSIAGDANDSDNAAGGTRLIDGSSLSSSSSSSPDIDPLKKLPFEILWNIADFLDATSMVRLFQALRVWRALYDSPRFWRARIQRDMPWLFAMCDGLSPRTLADVDWRLVYAKAADHSSLSAWAPSDERGSFFVFPPMILSQGRPPGDSRKSDRLQKSLLGLANIRRIWSVCLQVIEMYRRIGVPHQYSKLLYNELFSDE